MPTPSRPTCPRAARNDARSPQGESKAEKKLRKAAARQLKLNLLDQLKLHIDEPDMVKALHDATLFTQLKPAKKTDGAA